MNKNSDFVEWVGKDDAPISLKKWIWSFRARSDAPILCTGASPHRCR